MPCAHNNQGAQPSCLRCRPRAAGVSGLAAIKRSWALVRPLRWQLAGPFVGLVVAQRLLDAGKGWLLTSMPPRCD